MFAIAQTNVQLFNQLRALGWSAADLATVNRAYEETVRHYAGYFQADGKPFVCHCVGVAGILAHLGFPVAMVAAGMLHNVYGNGDFGDGRDDSTATARRRQVRAAVGEETEALVFRFREFRITEATIDRFLAVLPRLDATERALLVMDLADFLEKVADLGALYMADGDWAVELPLRRGEDLAALAEKLEQPELAAAFREAILRLAAERPAGGRPSPADRRRYLKLITTPSCGLRPYPRAVTWLRRLFWAFAARAGLTRAAGK